MPNILMVQAKRNCKEEKTWEQNNDKAHGGTEGQRYDFCFDSNRSIYFWGYTNAIVDIAKMGKPEATHHGRILELPRQS
jgi:hypothetical protein